MRLDGPLARRHGVHIVGEGERLLVFSHGFDTAQAVWHKVVRGVPRQFRAMLFDLPGASLRLPRDFQLADYRSVDRFAQNLLDLLEEVEVERCEYVGHSLSGMVGLLAAKAAPEKFERLVLLNASPRHIEDCDYVGGFSEADVKGLIRSMETNYRSWVAGFAPLAIYAPVPEAVEDFSEDLQAMRPDVAARIAQFIFKSDYRALLPEIEPPVCLFTRARISLCRIPSGGICTNIFPTAGCNGSIRRGTCRTFQRRRQSLKRCSSALSIRRQARTCRFRCGR